MKKVAVLFHDGFEVLEALSVVDVMTRANVTCTMVGMDKLEVESSHHIKVVMDCLCDENIETYDALVIPGGLPGLPGSTIPPACRKSWGTEPFPLRFL